MAKMYYAKDCDINYLNGKKIAIIGYGSQGHAHALNLKDSGCDVCVGLREGSKNWKNAEEAGLKVMSISEAAKWGDIVMMLINDEVQADVYKRDIAPNPVSYTHLDVYKRQPGLNAHVVGVKGLGLGPDSQIGKIGEVRSDPWTVLPCLLYTSSAAPARPPPGASPPPFR